MISTIAIAGCPNAGKSTLFNRLAGARQTVGNWPGQTVEQHEGLVSTDGQRFRLVDLPGTYGLVAVSAEESIATEFLIRERPAAVITVVDATNLSSGLHLVAQIAEAGLHQVVALNMMDVADRRGITIDERAMEDRLGVRVVRTVARRGDGVEELRAAAAALAAQSPPAPLVLDYGPVMERHLGGLVEIAIDVAGVGRLTPIRWTMLQLLAGDERTASVVKDVPGGGELLAATRLAASAISAELGLDAELAIAERRFEWVVALVDQSTGPAAAGPTWSDRFDRVLTHQVLGVPVFLAVMWIVLGVTADVTAPVIERVDAVISGPVSAWAVSLLGALSLDGGWVESLVVDGILAGVGSVLVFVPVLFALYLMLAVLEDSGYMARAAAVMDRAMRAVGIPGKAFLPMMVGFGCTVPAIYATRTLDAPRDRLLTGLVTPFMSCGARLPVYVLLASAFFAGRRSAVVFAMYMLGILVAVLIGLLLSRTVLREREPTPFVMVLPAFRLPNARTVWALVRQRTWAFVKGAGTVILGASLAVWLLLAIPLGGNGRFADTDMEHSAFGGVSKAVAPVLEPLGFGAWEHAGALLTGFVAKEVVVSTMAQLHPVQRTEGSPDPSGDPGEIGAIRTSFEESSDGHGALAGLAFMVFVLLYTPCVATVSAIRQEFGTRWMWVSVIGQFAVAWIGALIVFQGGLLLGLG